MKSKVGKIIGGLVGLSLLLGGGIFAATKLAESKSIGADNAVKFALADAGFDASQVHLLRADFEREDGKYIYEVDFIKDGAEYDYDILASDGTIIKRDIGEGGKYPAPSQAIDLGKAGEKQVEKQEPKSKESNSKSISLDQAKEIVLQDAGFKAEEVSFIKETKDFDDGLETYELDFIAGQDKYDYEVSVVDGRILDKDLDKGRPSQDQDSGAYISIEKAKEIALDHAGLTSANFSKAKLKREDGLMVYEIEFYADNVEYEYELQASDGLILDWDRDLND